MTHGVIGNTSDFGSAESWFEPRWVNKKSGSESESVNANASGNVGADTSVICLMLSLENLLKTWQAAQFVISRINF